MRRTKSSERRTEDIKQNCVCGICGKELDYGGWVFLGMSEDYYMVKAKLWKRYGNGNGDLCMGCLEKRMGRKLTRNDFTDCLANDLNNDVRRIRGLGEIGVVRPPWMKGKNKGISITGNITGNMQVEAKKGG